MTNNPNENTFKKLLSSNGCVSFMGMHYHRVIDDVCSR